MHALKSHESLWEPAEVKPLTVNRKPTFPLELAI